jgi:hypothetical protein
VVRVEHLLGEDLVPGVVVEDEGVEDPVLGALDLRLGGRVLLEPLTSSRRAAMPATVVSDFVPIPTWNTPGTSKPAPTPPNTP